MNKKILKCIGIILLVIIAFLIIHTVRNMVIMKQISKKEAQYKNVSNYYIRTTSTQGNVVDFYRKDKRYIMKLENISPTGVRKLTNYFDGEKVNTYIEAGNDKIAMLNSNGLPSKMEIRNLLDDIETKQFIFLAMLASIRNTDLNGLKCYKIGNFLSPNILMLDTNFEIYIEKETGLIIKEQNGTFTDENGNKEPVITDYEYQFDCVTDEDLVEPDISEYKIQENN